MSTVVWTADALTCGAGALDGDALKLIDKHCQLAKQIASVARILRDERV